MKDKSTHVYLCKGFNTSQRQVSSLGIKGHHKVQGFMIGGPGKLPDLVQLNAETLSMEVCPLHMEGDREPAGICDTHNMSSDSAHDNIAEV